MNKPIVVFLLCLISTLSGFAQNIVVPEVIRWDSTLRSARNHLFFNDSSLVFAGVDYALGRFLSEMDDSMKILNRQSFSTDHSLDGAAFMNGMYYLGGTQSVNSPVNTLAMTIIQPNGFPVTKGRSNFESVLTFAEGLSITQDSGAIVFGMGKNNQGERMVNLSKFDKGAHSAWEKNFSPSSFCYAQDVLETNSTSLFVTGKASGVGSTFRGAFLLKLNQDGDSLWIQKYSVPGSEGRKLFQSGEEHLLLAGTTIFESTPNFTKFTPYLAKVDTFGNLLWEYSYDWMIEDSIVNSFTFDDAIQTSDGGVLFVSTFRLYKNPLTGEFPYLYKVGPDGQYQWHKLVTPPNGENGSDARVIELENGKYGMVMTAQSNFPTFLFTRIALLSGDGTFTSLETLPETIQLSASPNPATDLVEVIWQQETAGEVEIELLDIQGRVLWRAQKMQVEESGRMKISLSDFPDGIYVVEVKNPDGQGSVKVVKRE